MSDDEVSAEEMKALNDAFYELQAAIYKYYSVSGKGAMVDGWAIVAHIRTPEMEAKSQSSVRTLAPRDQAWPMTLGLFEVAHEREVRDAFS